MKTQFLRNNNNRTTWRDVLCHVQRFRQIPTVLIVSVLLLMVALFAALPGFAQPATDNSALPKDILERWQQVSGGEVSGDLVTWIDQGEQIRREITDCELKIVNAPSPETLAKITSLREQFIEILKKVERERISRMSAKELQEMRLSYLAERERGMEALNEERKELISRAEEFLQTAKANEFLSRHPLRSEVMEDFEYRLGELYYQDAGSEFLKRFDAWSAQADSARQGLITQTPTPPQPDYSKAENSYLQILEEYPHGKHVDDCLFNLAKIFESQNNPTSREKALNYYERLATLYPGSRYMPMVYMGIGDYWFFKEMGQTDELETDLGKAIEAYKSVLTTSDNLMYNDAYFKIGWSYYRMNHFPEAVEAFTQCIETTISLKGQVEPSEYTSFAQNSIRYLALLFTSKQWGEGGLDNAAKFVQENPVRHDTYGEAVIHQMGDIHAKIYEWDAAIAAYNLYLMFFPLRPEAVVVHEQKIAAMEKSNESTAGTHFSVIEERDLFLSLYGPGSDWRLANPDPELGARVDALREKFLFKSTDELTTAAVNSGKMADLEQAILFCHRFLDMFPSSKWAPQVRMNLAMMLYRPPIERFRDAFDQFMILSWSSPGDTTVQATAAKNAVASAYAIMQAEGQASSPLYTEDQRTDILKNVTIHSDFDSLFPTWYADLTVGEILYTEGLDTYLCLFPTGEFASDFLRRTGRVFFDRGKYEMSRYWLGQVEARFADQSTDVEEAYKMIFNGYYAELDYAGIEACARHILELNLSPEFKETVRLRLAESIFQSAEVLRQGANHQSAALNYQRVASEVPDFKYADASLFNSGLEYTAAKDYQNAVLSYQLLEEKYPTSEYTDRAMYNHAYLLATELKQPEQAAEVYMRLFNEYPKSPLRSDALFNASRSNAEAGNTAKAVQVNQTYAATYPGTLEAKSLLLDAAVLLGQSQTQDGAGQAAGVYQQFAEKYPNDPNVVRAHYERGSYLKRQGDNSGARKEFQMAVDAFRSLSQKGVDGIQVVKPLASKSLFTILTQDIQTYKEIQLSPRARLAAQIAEKKRQSEVLVKGFDQLIAWSEAEAIWAMVQRAELLEEYATCYRNQAPPTDDDPITQGEKLIQIARDAVGYQQLAVEEYLRVLSELPKTRTVLLERSQTATGTDKQVLDSLVNSIAVKEDYCRNKSIDLRLSNADQLNVTLIQVLSLPDSKKGARQTRLRRQFTFWNTQLLPVTIEVVDLYHATIQAMEGLEAEGRAPSRPEVGQKAREASTNAVKEYLKYGQTLTRRAVEAYRETVVDYAQVLIKGDNATLKGMQASDFVALGEDYNKKANVYAQATVQTGSDFNDRFKGYGFDRSYTSLIEDLETAFVVEYASRCGENGKDAEKGLAGSRVGYNDQKSLVYEDALFVFEQWVLVWSQYQLDILKRGVQFVEKYSIVSNDANTIRQNLATLDPKYYESISGKPQEHQ